MEDCILGKGSNLEYLNVAASRHGGVTKGITGLAPKTESLGYLWKGIVFVDVDLMKLVDRMPKSQMAHNHRLSVCKSVEK